MLKLLGYRLYIGFFLGVTAFSLGMTAIVKIRKIYDLVCENSSSQCPEITGSLSILGFNTLIAAVGLTVIGHISRNRPKQD